MVAAKLLLLALSVVGSTTALATPKDREQVDTDVEAVSSDGTPLSSLPYVREFFNTNLCGADDKNVTYTHLSPDACINLHGYTWSIDVKNGDPTMVWVGYNCTDCNCEFVQLDDGCTVAKSVTNDDWMLSVKQIPLSACAVVPVSSTVGGRDIDVDVQGKVAEVDDASSNPEDSTDPKANEYSDLQCKKKIHNHHGRSLGCITFDKDAHSVYLTKGTDKEPWFGYPCANCGCEPHDMPLPGGCYQIPKDGADRVLSIYDGSLWKL